MPTQGFGVEADAALPPSEARRRLALSGVGPGDASDGRGCGQGGSKCIGRCATRRFALRSTVTFVLGCFRSCEMTEKWPGIL